MNCLNMQKKMFNQQSRSAKSLPKIAQSRSVNDTFSRDLLSSTVPKFPSRVSDDQDRKEAWANTSSADASKTNKYSFDESGVPGQIDIVSSTDDDVLLRTNPFNPLQAETIIASGLIRIVDQLAKKILPWQAILCPRAVETMQDLRLSMIQNKHTSFMNQMRSKLEEKVNAFITTKEQEVELWLGQELQAWQEFLEKDQTDLTEFIQEDLKRISHRALEQENSYKHREILVANELDDFERDKTREQLINFRKIVRASKQAVPSNQTLFDQEPKVVEVRVLQDSIAHAKSNAQKKVITNSRVLIRKQEECHDWLCSLADNALTAAISEEKVKSLYEHLDKEKVKSMDSLMNAMSMYKEQHSQIIDAITIFAGRIHQHATDYLQREQLVNRAYMQYLIGVISGICDNCILKHYVDHPCF